MKLDDNFWGDPLHYTKLHFIFSVFRAPWTQSFHHAVPPRPPSTYSSITQFGWLSTFSAGTAAAEIEEFEKHNEPETLSQFGAPIFLTFTLL